MKNPLVAGVAAVLVTAALSGCAGATADPISTVTSASPTPRPTPITVVPAVVVPVAPAPAFGGDCSIVATEAEVSDATGSQVTLDAPSEAWYGDWMVRGLGGIRCSWSPEDGSGVWVTVIPVASAGQVVIDESSADEPYCYGACSFSTTIGDWWYAGVAYTAYDSGIDPTDAINELVADFSSRSAAHPAAVPTRADGTWADVPQCDVLGESVDTTPIVGAALEPSTAPAPGEAGPGFYGAMRASHYSTCFWQGDGPMIDVGLLPGAWWVVDQQGALPGAVPVEVPGAVKAVLVPAADETSGDTIYVTDGANLATISSNYDADQLGALAVAVMDAVAA